MPDECILALRKEWEKDSELIALARAGVRSDTLSSLRMKVAKMQTDVDLGDQVTVLLDDVLALIDKEMRDA